MKARLEVVIQPQICVVAAAIMALRPMTRLGLVSEPRRPDASTAIDEPEDERDIRISLSRLASTLSAHGEVLLSADLALDLLLNRIAEQARLATHTTGAAIALRRGDDIVCRATTGANAPDLGVRLNLSSGLSGACVQTREVQSCGDTETDLRVDAIACRQLGVRSILIVPVLKEHELLGVFEVFSPLPHVFGDRDVQTLHALSRRAVDSITRSAEAVAPRRFIPPPEPVVVARPRRRDPWMLVLTVVVVALAVLLGWLLGRDGWQRPVRGMNAKSAQEIHPEAAPASSTTPPNSLQTPPDSARPAASSGGLVFYQNGKVIYRARQQVNDIPEPPAATLPPQVAERYVVQRVEPGYPEAARDERIQGQVVLDATVAPDGTVQELKVVSGDAQLATAAADAVRQWRFRPFLKAGKAVEFETQVTVDFRLP